jgi:hypothetical protein
LHKIRRAATQGPISSHPFSASGEGAGG